jgi:hypothetical protein
MKTYKKFLGLFALQLLCTSLAWAKTDLQVDHCTLHAAVTNAAEIVLTVSGQCTVMFQKNANGDATKARSLLQHANVVIKRHDRKPDDWANMCARAMSLVSQKIWIDCDFSTVLVEDALVRHISSLDADFGPLNPQPNASAGQGATSSPAPVKTQSP